MHDGGKTRVRAFSSEEFYIREAFPHKFAYILASDTRVPRIYRADVIISGISLAFLSAGSLSLSLTLSKKKYQRNPSSRAWRLISTFPRCWWNFLRDVIDHRGMSLRFSPHRWQSRGARSFFFQIAREKEKLRRAKRATDWRFFISREIKFEQLNRCQSVANFEFFQFFFFNHRRWRKRRKGESSKITGTRYANHVSLSAITVRASMSIIVRRRARSSGFRIARLITRPHNISFD